MVYIDITDLPTYLAPACCSISMNLSVLLCLVWGLLGYAWGCAQLRTPNMVVSEADGTVRVCAMFTEPVTSSGQLTIATSPVTGGAISPNDFIALSMQFNVLQNQTSDLCADITVNTDIIFEELEVFDVSLISANVPLCPNDTVGSVSILDSTQLTVSFMQSVFASSNEQGMVPVCIVISGGLVFERDVTYTLTAVANEATATRSVDFTFDPPRRTVTFLDNILCDDVMIVPDDIVEADEFFTVTIADSDINLVGGSARVVISDDDETEVDLVAEFSEVVEGNVGTRSVSLCVVLDSSLVLERDINLILNTQQVSATPGDYVELVDAILTIPDGSMRSTLVCETITIISDIFREPDETFTVEIRPENDNDMLSTVSFRVIILDDGDVIANCGNLDDPANGMVDTSMGTAEGNNATYTCMVGFELVGNSIRQCQTSGVWTGAEPTCQIADCGTLPDPDNGAVNFSPSTTFQSVAIYTCDVAFILNTGALELSRTCQANGVWSLTAPTCEDVMCEFLPPPANGNVNILGFTFLSEAIYTCNFGFNLSMGGEFFTRTCQSTAEWTGTEPTCEFLDCGVLPDIVFGMVDQSDGTGLGNVTIYTCDAGFTLLGDSTRVCGNDEVWSNSEPSCADLTLGISGIVSSGDPVLVQANLDLTCMALGIPVEFLPGTNIVWLSPEGEVVTSVDMANSLVLELNNLELGDSGNYICRLVISSDLLDGGSVTVNSVFDLQVQPIDCGQLDNPENGAVNLTGVDFNDVAIYTCEDGHILEDGNQMRTCMANAMWSGVAPVCGALCVTTVLLVLDGVDDCTDWIVIDTQEKLDDIDSFVESSIASSCGCPFTDDNILSGSFSCPGSLPLTAVAYQSEVRGFDTDAESCSMFVEFLEVAVQENQNISVFGEELDLRTDCELTASFAVRCGDEEDGLSIFIIVGVAAGGGVLLIILIIFVVLLVLLGIIIKKRRDKKRRSENNVVILNSTYTRDSPPPFRPITDYVNTTPKKIDLGRTVSRDNRLRDRYSDNTLPKKEKANGRFEMVREPLYDHLKVRRAPK